MNEAEKKLRELFGEDPAVSGSETPERPIHTEPRFPLRDIWPDTVALLEMLLVGDGEADLARTVNDLYVFGRCECGQPECATVDIKARIPWGYGPNHRTIAFYPHGTSGIDRDDVGPTAPHLTVLDVVGNEIVSIEILGDRELARILADALDKYRV